MAGERVACGEHARRRYASCSRELVFKLTDSAAEPPENFLQPRVCEFHPTIMRDDYLQAALKVVDDPNILVNVVSRRVKQLKRGNRALVESLEKLSAEDTALREIIEGKISFELATPAELARSPAA